MKRSAIKTDLFAGDKRREKLDALGDPLVFLERHVDFVALAAEVDRVAPRPVSENGGGRPPYPTETMVRILILKRLHNLSDEQIEYQLLDRMSYQRFCGLTHSASIPDRNTVWVFENRIGLEGAAALFEAVQKQLVRHGYMARCGQRIDATLVPAPKRKYRNRITGELALPARAARAAPFPDGLDARLLRALAARDIHHLYSHQREVWEHVAAGRHCVVVTPTASGKTLCYNLPVLQAAIATGAKALYLFPTKALSQDQVAEILALDEAGGLGVRACAFDGDTPGDARAAVRTKGDVVVSNPDMLHQGILPHHTKWARFFEHNRLDVISLVALTAELAHVHAHPGYRQADAHALARSHVRGGRHAQALAHLEACRANLDDAGRLELARLYRQLGEWDKACALWQPLAARGVIAALLALTKYHEHVTRDYASASAWCHQLAARQPDETVHLARMARLRRKLGATSMATR